MRTKNRASTRRRGFTDRIPNNVLREIFPERLNKRSLAAEELYTHLKKMILFGKLKKGQKLTLEGIAQHKLIGGHISQNIDHETIFNFITKKGTFSYNERRDEFKSKLEIR